MRCPLWFLAVIGCAQSPEGDPQPVQTPPSWEPGVEVDVWSGTQAWSGTVEVRASENVQIEPGARFEIAPGTRLVLHGRMRAFGTREAPIVFDAPDGWQGIELHGELTGTYVQIRGAGGDLRMQSGWLDLTDSTLDLVTNAAVPDCTSIQDGVVRLDHVQITGCHCPIHINAAQSVEITNSIFDVAAVPVMIARTTGALTGNHFIGSPGVMDVGGGLDVDLSGNFWGGGSPTVQTSNPSQFSGTDDFSNAPFAGAGPR